MMNKLELYIHIPFCQQKCKYCDFLSGVVNSQIKKEYVETLIDEIKVSKNLMSGYEISTVFIGGGTPSILPGEDIYRIVQAVKENSDLQMDAEITIECNPGTVDEEKFNWYKKAGINRISFGLQSGNNGELDFIGRIHTYEDFEKNYILARKVGFNNINIDLMSALPYQTLESYKETLNKVITLKPEHISAYSLIVEEDTPMYDIVENNPEVLPSEYVEREMYYETEKLLGKAGYNRYEISNYSLEGYECKHNLGYWRRVNYLGFGIGAASLVDNQRFSNIISIKHYCKFNELEDLREEEQVLSTKEQMEEYMFLGLRVIEGINTSNFEETFHKTYESIYGKATNRLIEKGMLKKQGNNIRLTKKGIDVSNRVLSEFLL